MKLSVIITAYNLEQYIGRCLCSILPQLTADCELIIIDDHSTDLTIKKINQCLALYKSGALLVQNPVNKGVSYSRNQGLQQATGKYVAFIDGDDAVTSDYIKVILESIKTDRDTYTLSWRTSCKNQYTYKADDLPVWNTAVWSRIWKRSIIKYPFNEDKQWAEDSQFIAENIQPAMSKGTIMPVIYVYRNDRPGSLTQRSTPNFIAREDKLINIIIYSTRFVSGGMEMVAYYLIWFLLCTGKYDIKVLYEDSTKSSKKMLDRYAVMCDVVLVKQPYMVMHHCDVLINCTYNKLVLPFVKAKKTVHAIYSNIPMEIANNFNRDNTVISQSNWHKDMLQKVGLNSTIITNALDITSIREKSNEVKVEFDPNIISYLMVCRISAEKGFDQVIEFMKRPYNLNNVLYVLGAPFNEKDIKLQQMVQEALDDRVEFLGETDNPYPFIKAADYLCSFSTHELYGLATEEAHILQTPVVFSHYETAIDQFIPEFDQWVDEFIPVKRDHVMMYNDSKNIASIKQWEDIIMEENVSSHRVNFYAQAVQYFDHMAPVWHALPEENRGIFYINPNVAERARDAGIPVIHSMPPRGLTLVASYDDYQQTQGPVIWMDHGIGNTYSNMNPYYAGGPGKDRVVLFLNPHRLIHNKNKATYPKVPGIITGTPKMDTVENKTWPTDRKPVVCLSFHWKCEVAPETMSAFDHYEKVIPTLAASKDFDLIFHGHPKEDKLWDAVCNKYHITRVKKLSDVFDMADIYVCDNSSSMYEFMATGRPVIVLNAPWYRRYANHGIRFWHYIPGVQVDEPQQLMQAVMNTIARPAEWKKTREDIARVLYPHRGESAKKTAQAVVDYINGTLKEEL